jgi:hypothetical protein
MKMLSSCQRVEIIALALFGTFAFGGCAATQVALEHKDLAVSTKMSSTVFLDVENRVEKTIYLDVKNTSDREMDVRPQIQSRLTAAGYTLAPSAADAFYILQANILQVGVANPSALSEALGAGFGGPLAGMAAGAVLGANSSSPQGIANGAAIGGLIGAAGEMIAGALVKNVTYSMITDLQIMERSAQPVNQTVSSDLTEGTGTRVVQTSTGAMTRRKYQTRIVSTANQVNLKFEEALPVLQGQLAKSIAGIF